ncbi:type II toxin-antitoxin system VapC family toxin [Amycolatopsis pithecellobii]|uniref:Ribonuclease VapC n=1 Tax=Amycolatopsis pithecellobii TaxID=664692 RepID=A0A6N7ZAY3_9PSEU|nr:PIN domain-containing protein [Amycolatopsis pithecellobii]MTD58835.1 PIN domain-containing protein [Amycolatopsis pithecellobii]
MVICDTGPLVAATIRRDPDYHRCVELFTGLHLANRPLIVPSPIIAEVGYLLGRYGNAKTEAGFLRSLADGSFVPTELTSDDYDRMAELVEQYADLPLGTSDAAVIALAERLDVDEVATLDLRHFTVVRPRHVKAFTLLPE